MPEIVEVSLSDLLVDTRNARLEEEQDSQPAAILAMAKQQGRKLIKIAQDILENGMNPLVLPGIIPTGDQRKRYTVIEGNRRVTALKALETPALIHSALDPSQRTTWNKLADRYADNPIDQLHCALFKSEEELAHWVRLVHTGENEGVGLVAWGSNEKDRYEGRFSKRSPAGQVLDFVEEAGGLSDAAAASTKGIITSVKRLLGTPEVREILGINVSRGEVSSWFPREEVAKGLTKIVEDLKTEKLKVGDIYHVQQRIDYAKSIPPAFLPDPNTRLDAPADLLSVTPSPVTTKSKSTNRRRRARRAREVTRTALVPASCHLEIPPPRINGIFTELQTLSADQYPNAATVILRVFVELSTDHYLTDQRLLDDQDLRNAPLAKKLKLCAEDLRKRRRISQQLETVIQRVADGGRSMLAASVPTMHLYVHNYHAHPKASEIRIAWDELQPFLEALWPSDNGSDNLAG